MRRILLALICFFFIIREPVCVYAHPGRTDGSGGHHNRSTGEYHYHHGYGEHQHSDMDGDGDLDCPYDFEDKTRYYDTPKVTIDPRLIEEMEEWHQKIQDYTYPDEYTKINEDKNKEQKNNDNNKKVTLESAMSNDSGNSSTETYFDWYSAPFYVMFISAIFMLLSFFMNSLSPGLSEFIFELSLKAMIFSIPFIFLFNLLFILFE